MKTTLQSLVPLFIFSLQFYPKIVISSTQDAHYVMHNCENSNDTYITGSTFQSTLNDTLFSILPAKAMQAAFFSFTTNGTSIDQLYAQFYCRGDVDALACYECVLAAADKITKRCQFLKEAIVWFEECTLRYANRNFFKIDEEEPLHIYTNKTGIMNDYDLDPFKKEFDSAMDKLIHQAASLRNLDGFAATQVNLSSNESLHCTVQCTPDISGALCQRCLNSAVKQRDKWADTMIFMPSCFLRVDLYNSTTTPISTDSNSNGRSSKKYFPAIMIAAISVACVIVFGILACFYCYIRYWPDVPPNLALPGNATPRKFTYIQLAVATNGFIRLNYLGHGGFGCVYKGVLRGQKVAVKRLMEVRYGSNESRQHRQQQSRNEFESEVINNFNAVHNNIVKVVGYCNQGNHKMIVYELVENNSLHKHLIDNKHGNLTWEKRMNIAIGCARGLEYLHRDRRIIHRDIKPSNILLESDYEPKLADFGLSKVFPDDASYVRTLWRGTHGYLDPEYFQRNRLTLKSDVYSFGIVLLQLITGMKPRAWDYDPGYILWLLLQDLRHFAFDRPVDTATINPRVFMSDGPNHSARHGERDSSSDGRYDSASENLQEFAAEYSKGSASKCPEIVLSEDQKEPVLECSVNLLLPEDPRSHTSEFPNILSKDPQCSTSRATDNPMSNSPEYMYLKTYVDPNLARNYNMEQMVHMIICAAMCVHSSQHYRLGMTQVVKLLEERNVVANDDDVARIITHTGAIVNDPHKLLDLNDLKQLATLLLEGVHPNSNICDLENALL